MEYNTFKLCMILTNLPLFHLFLDNNRKLYI